VSPLDELLKSFSAVDFAVLQHGFAGHGRDYEVIAEDGIGPSVVQYEILFTHCVRADYETRVGDADWLRSWTDEFTDYQRWTDAKEPAGYVWGTNWSLAYPGLRAVIDSEEAARWSGRLGKPMFEVELVTDRFCLRLVFHSIRSRKLNSRIDPVSQVIVGLPPSGTD
jgi:hypothetical protein